MQQESKEIPSLTLLIVICDRGKVKEISPFFRNRHAVFNLLAFGKGTANSKILNYLGLGQVDKTALLSVMPVVEARDVLSGIDEALDLKRPGHGIAFTLPVDGICVKNARAVPEENEKSGGNKVEQEYRHALILAVANRGYDEEVMDAARAAKATGGTIINARGFASSGAEKFFGVTLQPEREVILILAPSEKKFDIMQAIADKAGVGSPANTVTLSLPVSDVMGLQSYLPQAES